MSPHTKQYEHTADDLTDEIKAAWRKAKVLAAPQAALEQVGTVADGPPLAGALVLRGCRCVLVRSHEKPPVWEGMKLPALPRIQVAAADAALKAVVDR